MKQPLRILNEPPAFFGLSIFDLAGLGWCLVLSHSLLEPMGLGLLSLLLTAFAAAALATLRMRYRRKIIRDSARLILRRRFS